MSKPSLTKKALLGAVALSIKSTAWSAGCQPTGEGNSSGCEGKLGVNYLSLDENPGRNVELCADNDKVDTKTGSNVVPNELSVVIDPFVSTYPEMIFSVSDIIANDEAHILYLVYSPMLSPSPQIPTPRSKIKFQLDMAAIQFIGIYNVPALPLLPMMSTPVGSANPAPTSRVSFKVNLDKNTIPIMMGSGEETIYLQAALVRKVDYDQQSYSNMILSEVDTITFVKECSSEQSSSGMDSNGTLTTVLRDDDGNANTSKTTQTQTAAESSTTKTKY